MWIASDRNRPWQHETGGKLSFAPGIRIGKAAAQVGHI